MLMVLENIGKRCKSCFELTSKLQKYRIPNAEYRYRRYFFGTYTEYRISNGPFLNTEYRYRRYQKNTERQLWRVYTGSRRGRNARKIDDVAALSVTLIREDRNLHCDASRYSLAARR